MYYDLRQYDAWLCTKPYILYASHDISNAYYIVLLLFMRDSCWIPIVLEISRAVTPRPVQHHTYLRIIATRHDIVIYDVKKLTQEELPTTDVTTPIRFFQHSRYNILLFISLHVTCGALRRYVPHSRILYV